MEKWSLAKKIEASLAVGLCVALCAAFWVYSSAADVSERVLRLHVVAHSDSDEDQALKLRVRDRILRETEPMLAGIQTSAEAAALLEDQLPILAHAAANELRAAGWPISPGDTVVTVRLGQMHFPTRQYEGFALPAGEYETLKVVIGEGGGQNWWCVVFPPLCSEAATGGKEPVDASQVAFVPDDDGRYEIKFYCLELWDSFQQWIGG